MQVVIEEATYIYVPDGDLEELKSELEALLAIAGDGPYVESERTEQLLHALIDHLDGQ